MVNNKYRVHDVAQDFGCSTKEVTDLLEKLGDTSKKSMTALSDDELNILFESITKSHEVKNFDEYFSDMIGVSRRNEQDPEDVVLRFPKDQYKYVATKPWHGSQKVVDENNCTITLQFHVVLNYELEQKILSFGQYVEVISPMTLRERIKDRLSQSLQQYNP